MDTCAARRPWKCSGDNTASKTMAGEVVASCSWSWCMVLCNGSIRFCADVLIESDRWVDLSQRVFQHVLREVNICVSPEPYGLDVVTYTWGDLVTECMQARVRA